MKALLYTYGTRGDVEPYLALALALDAAGHEVVLSAPASFESFVTGRGIRYAPRDNGFLDLVTGPAMRAAMAGGPGTGGGAPLPAEGAPSAADLNERIFPALLSSMVDAALEGVDLVVHKHDYAHHIAERLGVPGVLGLLHPHFVPSRYYPSSLALAPERTSWVTNLISHARLRLRGEPAPMRALVERWRAEELELAPRRGMHDRFRQADGSRVPVLHGYSEYLAPHAPDWPSSVRTTGFWWLPPATGHEPDPALDRFLTRGEPPVFFGFGSLVGTDPARSGRIVREVVERLGIRAVVALGAGGIDVPDPPDSVFVVREADYAGLLPRVRAVVHAGGLGTAHHALAAGVPQVTYPFHVEQMGWARRLHRIGVAPPPRWQRDLTADDLAASLDTALTDPRVARAASRLRDGVRAERGERTAVAALEAIHHAHRGKRHA